MIKKKEEIDIELIDPENKEHDINFRCSDGHG